MRLIPLLLVVQLISAAPLLASQEPAEPLGLSGEAHSALGPAPAGSPVLEQHLEPQLSGRSASIDLLLDRAINRNIIAGGVVVVGNRDGIISTTARGRLNGPSSGPYLNERTIFDLASLTKVIATTPAVMKLLDQGKIGLADPLTRWFPEFKGERDDLTVLNLLTHTSGLDDVSFHAGEPISTSLRKAATHRSLERAGRFHYADINFILLGELVHRVSGERLDEFCREEIFHPLGVRETMFLPPKSLAEIIAPTTGYAAGVVQDPNARQLGGVAGHAGLFSSAADLARFARMVLGGGVLDGKRILSERIVSQMTSPHLCNNGTVMRGLGWDIVSPYSAPKGRFFSNSSFGHTGYSGSSIWIDPQQDLFVILLTNRLNYRNTHVFNQLRRDVSTIASASFRRSESGDLPQSWQVAALTSEMQQAPVRIVPVSAHRHFKGKYAQKCKTHGKKHQIASLKKKAHRIARTARSDGYSKKKRTQNRRA